MEIYFLDKDFKISEIIDDFFCFIRRRSYYGVDEFELHCREDKFFAAKNAEYLISSDLIDEVYLVETVIVRNQCLLIKGRAADCLFERGVIYPTCKISGSAEEVLRYLVSQYSDIGLGEINNLGSIVERTQITGYGLLEYMQQLCLEQQLSMKVVYDQNSRCLKFTVWQGKDRTQQQTLNSPVIFSEDFENIISCEYSYSEKDYRNIAIVAGQGSGQSRKWVVIDQSEGSEKRELYVDARDLQQEDDMTDSQYESLLRRRGLEKLAKYSIVESFEASVNPNNFQRYKTDFDLGDKVTVCSRQLGITLDCRITEIEEIYENGGFSLNLGFGDGFLSTISYMERMLK